MIINNRNVYAQSPEYTPFENDHFLEFFIHLGPDIHLRYGTSILFLIPFVAELTALNL
jgi:hypothetical protein